MVNVNKVKLKATIFKTNIGRPQGNGLSRVLFIIYIENALKKLRKKLRQCTLIIKPYQITNHKCR